MKELGARERSDTCQELRRIEGLGDEVIGSGGEAIEQVVLAAGGGEHQNRKARFIVLFAQEATHFEPRHLRHVPVEHQHVWAITDSQALQNRRAVGEDVYVVLLDEHAPRHFSLQRAVVDQPHPSAFRETR